MKRTFRCSAAAVWNSLPQTVLSSDSVAVFKSKDIPLLPGFLFFLCSLTRCLAPAPLKLRPYGAKPICLLLLLLLLLYYYYYYHYPSVCVLSIGGTGSDDAAIESESVPIQLAQCRFPGLAISNARI